MGKGKKKHSKKDKVSDDIMEVAAASLKKFRKVTRQIGKLSTGQKLVGGVALLAAGLTYLANRPADAPDSSVPSRRLIAPDAAHPAEPAFDEADHETEDAPAFKSRKARKPKLK